MSSLEITMELTELIALSVKHNASDLHLCCGDLPRWRCQGKIQLVPGYSRIDATWFQQFIVKTLNDKLQQQLNTQGHCDFAIKLTPTLRLRAALFTHNNGLSLALRLINSRKLTLEQLGLPRQVTHLVSQHQGLMLFTGATGAGKSTTLAAILDDINRHQQRHIITLEDPIEFCLTTNRSLIQQREVGTHMISFDQGMNAALRQDPDIIVVGELRDKATIQLALRAAETGHLVLATLHSTDSTHALQRMVDAFPILDRDTVRAQLAQSLVAILSQRLSYRQEETIALFELLINNSAIANIIREGRNHQLTGHIEMATQQGMQSFRQSQLQHQEEVLLAASALNKDFQTSFPE